MTLPCIIRTRRVPAGSAFFALKRIHAELLKEPLSLRAVRAGKMIKLEIIMAPSTRMPITTATDVSREMTNW